MEKLLINDIPLSDLGAVLAPDSYKSVLTWSKFKSLQSNDWAEYNYVEYDLAQPTLDKRTVTLNFHANGADGYSRFMEYLMQYVYSYYEFPELGVTLRMRMDTNSLKSIDGKWQSFSINFFDDEPYRQQSSVVRLQNFRDTDYELDNVDLAQYGISILKGSYQSFVQIPQLKERLTISENSMDGAIYDHGSDIKFKQSSFTLKCLLRAETLQYAVANYYYIYELLRQSGARKIMYKNLRCNCFYNSCNITAVHSKMSSGNAGIAFDVTFNVVDFAKDYDSKVEYLESTGTQWINTLINFKPYLYITFNALYTDKFDEAQVLVSASSSGGCWVGNVPNKLWGINPRGVGNSGIKTNLSIYYNGNTTILYINNTQSGRQQRNIYPEKPFTIFGSYNADFGSSAKLYSISIIDNINSNNETFIFNAIPVRRGNVGYLYDKVSGKLFGNSGTGQFILGQDIND